jgi:hypothetical protein
MEGQIYEFKIAIVSRRFVPLLQPHIVVSGDKERESSYPNTFSDDVTVNV